MSKVKLVECLTRDFSRGRANRFAFKCDGLPNKLYTIEKMLPTDGVTMEYLERLFNIAQHYFDGLPPED